MSADVTNRVDRIATLLADSQDRRWAVRALGAAALVASGLGGIDQARAAERRGDRGDGPSKRRCRRGKKVQDLRVPADGSAVRTKRLAMGQKYTLRVSGFILDEEWGLDGGFYFLQADPANLNDVYDACFDGTDVGLSIDGEPPVGWGAYDTDHGYERKVVGSGKALSLSLADCNHDGQTGSLRVEIRCG